MLSAITEERFKLYYVWQNEFLIERIFPICSKIKGERVHSVFSIVDLEGISLGMITKQVYKIIQFAAKTAQDNYPEIMGKY